LGSRPPLRRPNEAPGGESGTGWPGGRSAGPRAPSLLPLAPRPDGGHAGHALGIPRPTYRLALRRALPRRDDGRADPAAWLRLRVQVHRRIKTLPAERLATLARLREDALSPRPTPVSAPAAQRPAWLAAARAGVVACALLLAATYLPW